VYSFSNEFLREEWHGFCLFVSFYNKKARSIKATITFAITVI
jgi:hypothetical protein